jgi:hypothetical protein
MAGAGRTNGAGPGPASRRGPAARVLEAAARAVLGSLMSLAVIVAERRIGKALSEGAGGDQEPPPGGDQEPPPGGDQEPSPGGGQEPSPGG